MKLIEVWFPVKEISRDAGIEMSYKSAPAYIKHAKELGISKKITRDFFDPKIRIFIPGSPVDPVLQRELQLLRRFFLKMLREKSFLKRLAGMRKKEFSLSTTIHRSFFMLSPRKN